MMSFFTMTSLLSKMASWTPRNQEAGSRGNLAVLFNRDMKPLHDPLGYISLLDPLSLPFPAQHRIGPPADRRYFKIDRLFTAYDIITGPSRPDEIKGVWAENLFFMFVRA